MGRLIYTATMSLDGYVEDAAGKIDWSVPSDEVHSFVNDRLRRVGTFLFGRRMYETMLYWETPKAFAPGPQSDFVEIWRATDKIVYSKTLTAASSSRTRIERDLSEAAIIEMKLTEQRDINVGGAELAAAAMRMRVVDELQLFVVPAVLGNGKRGLPAGAAMKLELLNEHRFANGTVFLHYRTVS